MTPERPVRQKRRTFGLSWWGNAWVEAVESQSNLDQSKLPRGRTYARWGYVGPLTINPGVVTSRVAGSGATPYHTHVKVDVLTDEQWDQFFAVVAGRIAHAAALIDGELSSDLVDDALAVGINLLPLAGEISTGCSCPDAADLCKHSAAVCYLFADLLDEDPFALLHLRGRTQEEVTVAIREKRQKAAAPAPVAAPPSEEITAKEAFERVVETNLPHVPKPSSRPGVATLPTPDAPLGNDVHPEDLVSLAQGAAQRAWEINVGMGNSGLKDDVHSDLIRRLAPLLDTPEFAALCSRTHIIRSSAEEDARLWAAGGAVALDEGETVWDPDREVLDLAVDYLSEGGSVVVRNNRVTCKQSGRQLRIGESGTWYEYQAQGNRWRFKAIADL